MSEPRVISNTQEFEGAEFDMVSGPIDGLTVNGLEVAPLIEAELVRRHQEIGTFTATELSDDLRDRGVNGEWSTVETVRHLVFVVDLYVRRPVLGLGVDAYHPIGLPPSHMRPSLPGANIDAAAQPSFEQAIEVWEERLAEVRTLLDGLTPAEADATRPVDGPGFPPLRETIPIRRALAVVSRETWAHNRYLERDLAEPGSLRRPERLRQDSNLRPAA